MLTRPVPNQHPHQGNNRGFTLIELLLVTAMSVVLLLAASTLFMTFMLGSAKNNINQTIKAEGDYALATMESLLRNTKLIRDADCNNIPRSNIHLTNFDNVETTLQAVNNLGMSKIASTSSNGTFFLTADSKIDPAQPLTFTCQTTSDGSKYIRIRFALYKGESASNTISSTRVNFSGGVNVRNR